MLKWLYKKLKKKYDPYLPDKYVVYVYDEDGGLKSVAPYGGSVGLIFRMRFEPDYQI